MEDVNQLLKQLREEAELEQLKKQLVTSPNEKNTGDFIEEVVENSTLGFGAGVLTQIIFGAATGSLPSTAQAAISGPFVLLFTAIGFGLGFARGYRKMIGRH